jgi:hypothetical protein
MVGKYTPTGGQRGWLFGVNNSTGKVELDLSDDGSYTNMVSLVTDEGINPGQWHHLVATVDVGSDDFKIYINGIEAPSSFPGNLTITDIYSNSSSVLIGGPSNDYVDGLIDEVKIWNYALTAEQVKTDYNGGAVNFAP